ncbi:MAG: hydantoinase B/oxoprolinase family protein [Gammaproteobacteria bacterium]|nr:hydantoinase B/oxoprolinase family protein [Gammaproteobacteria bacterium]MCP4981034.1 hydantoinase B/oxoprolinase family protein [Gammaproteobacteria bacterium]
MADKNSAVELQVMWNRLIAVVDEQAQALMHTAFSPIVRESGDISAGVFDVDGNMLAQAVTGTPGHINTMAESVKHFLEIFPKHRMRPGDTYMTNDPWLGSGHLNDFVLVQPCFHRCKLVGLASCTSHLIDLGGLGMGPDGSDVYDEGLIIPPIRLVEAGTINETLMSLIKYNSRTPFQNEGDIYALIACCDVAHARLDEMMSEFGITSLSPVGRYIHEVSRKASVAAINAAPQGRFHNRMIIDGYDFEIELVANLTIGDGAIQVDFDGSSSCSRFGINVPLNYATAYSVFGLRCIFAPEVPNNAGSLEPFKVSAPSGCIVNAPRPVPVAQRHIIGQLLPDVVLGCLRKAMPKQIPAEGSSCMYDLPMRGGFDASSDRHATKFAVELTHNGGTGARPGKDGLSVTAFPSGVYGSQVEITESTSPLLVRRRELRTDSGGAGKFRGGLGQIIEIESRENLPFDFFGTVDRVKYPARGCFSGKDGARGHLALKSGQLIKGKGKQQIPAGETLVFQTPGGGGYGDPKKRSPQQVARDYAAGLISRNALKRYYGVVLKRDGSVDTKATRAQRKT